MRVLSIDGGGYLGLASAVFIRDTERHFKVSFHESFDLFCGTSTGAIIAIALATGMSGEQVVSLYEDLGPKVFPQRGPLMERLWNLGPRLLVAKYDNRMLRKCLVEAFGETKLGDVLANGKRLLVTAFSVSEGKPRIFKTDHAPGLSLHNNLRLSDIALASTAAPTFLPVVEIPSNDGGLMERFCDGGVGSNHPALLGFVEAVHDLKSPPSDVAVLSISTPREDLGTRRPKSRWLRRGVLSWVESLPSILIDANSTLTHECLRRLVSSYPAPHPYYARVSLENRERIPMDSTTSEASAALKQIGAMRAADSTTRERVAPLFTSTP